MSFAYYILFHLGIFCLVAFKKIQLMWDTKLSEDNKTSLLLTRIPSFFLKEEGGVFYDNALWFAKVIALSLETI